MTRHYSSKNFFRQVLNTLLARYFAERGLFGDLDFAALKGTKPDALFGAWLELPEEQRKPMDAEFQDIFGSVSIRWWKGIMLPWKRIPGGQYRYRIEAMSHCSTTL